MTDKELLDLAARAIGEHLSWMAGDKAAFIGDEIWDPPGDDGDALRLAAKLRIDIEHNDPCDQLLYVCASRRGVEMLRDAVSELEEIEDESQRCAATRRVIVRAAAAIGEGMDTPVVAKEEG